MVVYDGITGIEDVVFHKDTAYVSTLIPDSPADQAGIKPGDQIMAIDDSVVSGTGMNRRGVMQLLHDRSGKFIELKIKRKGEGQLLSLTLQRDPYLYQIDSYDYVYLVDSLEQWDIQNIMSPALDTLFRNPLDAKITVYAVEKGSPAERSGILPGDRIVSLADEVDKDYSYHISHDVLSSITSDTSLAILRDDSLIYLPIEPSLQGDFMGIKSQFENDFAYPCVWLKLTTENRLAASRTYLFNLPEMSGKDSLNFFCKEPSGEIIEKKSGILIPIQERDFIYKDWHAVKIALYQGETQTFHLRLKAEVSVGAPHLQVFAHDTIVRYDRFERMVLYGFIVTMLIISAFFLLLFAVMRRRQYLYFALYIGSLVIFLFIADGYLDEYFWKENNFFLKFLNKFQPYIMSWISIFFLLFGMAYLELWSALKHWYRSVVIVLSLTGIRILLVLIEVLFNFSYPAFIDRIFTVVWIFTVGIIPLFILIMPAIIRIRKGFQPAWYFLVANLVLIPLIYITIYSSLSTSAVIGIYESIFGRIFLSSGMYIAAILQILIFSFGIARKMRLDELENKRNQEQIIDQLKVNEKLKDKVKRELEQKVQERTREISEQKEEIQSQRDEIEEQRDMVFAQKKEITDSIDYAQRIQVAVLPRKEYLDWIMPEYFVFYKPKDVVSGDFYWIEKVNNSLIVVAADCTGHGVPGAFMSMLGITLLNEQLAKSKLDDPGKILDNLRSRVKVMLAQQGKTEEQKDGMDMTIAIIHKEKKELQFAGANSPLFLIRNSSQLTGSEPGLEASLASHGSHLFEFKGDRQPIGYYWEESKFTSHRIHLMEHDTVYVFSDGFIDQFGGEARKKYKVHRFKELLLSIQKESMDTQKQLLKDAYESWRGDIDQIDDVCVIGVRI
ncbi:MAG: PDZ domain-containing protein [Bacteroidia bacterium]|nr:MAG: PDZ domain-containing protein [Bacteroidia bacterium]